MPVKDYYTKPSYMKKYEYEGPFTQYLDSFADWLNENQFNLRWIRIDLRNIAHFNFYLSNSGFAKHSLSTEHINRFLNTHIPVCKCHWWGQIRNKKKVKHSIVHFKRYMTDVHNLNIFNESSDAYEICATYKNWLSQTKQMSPSVCKSYPRYMSRFLDWYEDNFPGKNIDAIEIMQIEQYLVSVFETGGSGYGVTILKSFFKYCYESDITPSPLYLSILSPKRQRLSGLPKGINDSEAMRFLSAIDRSSRTGKRAYVMVLLLYTYGVRGVQVRNLKLSDINWLDNEIYFTAVKGGKGTRFHLTGNVGNALIDYLKHARPEYKKSEHVFLTFTAPIKPVTNTLLNNIITAQMKEYGISSPVRGSHCFRHAFVSRILKNGGSIKQIADLVGHRYIDTTFIYSKVDIIALKEVPLELPEAVL